jgi:hypothetical protein
MYRGVVQDAAYQTEYLQDYIKKNNLAAPVNRGRIWRLTHETTRREKKPALAKETAAGLVPYLAHPIGWWRDTAQQLLVQRGDRSVAPALKDLLRTAPDWRTKLHAMGALAGLGALDAETLRPLFSDPSPDVRAWAIRWSEPWLAEPGHPLAAEALRLMDDPSWTVRHQLAASIGELPKAARIRSVPDHAAALRRRRDHGGCRGERARGNGRRTSGSPAGDGGATETTPKASPCSRARWPFAPRRRRLVRSRQGRPPRPDRRGSARAAARVEAGLSPGERTPEPDLARRASRAREDARARPALARMPTNPATWAAGDRDRRVISTGRASPLPGVEAPPLTRDEQARFDAGRSSTATPASPATGPTAAATKTGTEPRGIAPLTGDPGVPIRIVLAARRARSA